MQAMYFFYRSARQKAERGSENHQMPVLYLLRNYFLGKTAIRACSQRT